MGAVEDVLSAGEAHAIQRRHSVWVALLTAALLTMMTQNTMMEVTLMIVTVLKSRR